MQYDVVVVGGGPAGIGAAAAAARSGARTALLERDGKPGGMGTSALVNNFCNAHFDGRRFIIGGIFAELRDRLIESDGLYVTGDLEPYNHHCFVEEARALLLQYGVESIYDCTLHSLNHDGLQTDLHTTQGTYRTASVVDATGDAHVAQLSGANFWNGNKPVMPLTYCYLLGPVDIPRLRQRFPDAIRCDQRNGREYIFLSDQEELHEMVAAARRLGELTIPRNRIAVAYSVPGHEETVSVNFGRVTIADPTNEDELRKATQIGLQQVQEGLAFFRKYVPGFERVELVEVADRIGVRESRQIKGRYQLTGEDVLTARQFPDVIAQCCYPVDIHEPLTDSTIMRHLAPGEHYDIPLRCLVPENGPAGLIVAGRCISATQEAMSSFRVSPSVMAIGEAAGTAAALAVRSRIPVSDVDATALQSTLRAFGAILD